MPRVMVIMLCFSLAAVVVTSQRCEIKKELESVIADCRRMNFYAVPSEQLPSDTTELLLDHNNIQKLSSSAFANLTSIVRLSLRFNSLSHLSKDSLIHLPNLENLDVSHNPIWISESSLPRGVFSQNTLLKTLILPEGEIPASAIAGLDNLEMLQVAFSPTGDSTLPEVISTLPSLKILNLSYGRIQNLNSTMLDLIRNSSIEVLMFINSQITYVEPNLFKDFVNLRTINLACNEVQGSAFADVMQAFSVLGSTPLDTLILDAVNKEYPVMLRREDFCTDVRRVKRLSIKSNHIIGVYVDVFPCLRMEVLSFGYFNTPYFMSPILDIDDLWPLVTNIPIHTLDASYMFSMGRAFKERYCNSENPLFNDDYFPPSWESLPIVQSNITFSGDINSSAKRTIPPNIKYIDLNHFRMHPTGERYIFKPINLNNSLAVYNASYTQLVDKFPVTGNLWNLQIVDVSHSGLRAITKEASESFKDYVNLRHLILSHNQLFESGSDFDDTFAYLAELVSIDLSYNGITFMHNRVFAKNGNLEEILLNHNSLDHTTTLLLSSNTNLEYVDLSHNQFTHLSDSMMKELDHLTNQVKLDISHNSFVCNCDAINFIKWVNETEVFIVGHHLLECSYHNQTKQILHFPVEALEEECQKPDFDLMLKRILLGVLLPTVFIITSMSIAYKLRWHIRWNYYSLIRYYRKKSCKDQLQLAPNMALVASGCVMFSIRVRVHKAIPLAPNLHMLCNKATVSA
ncbi:hypothetical protein CAPTEDRAFT_190094 [Capitella teleta]|uniref:LRRCT domain-containing protein n=1 Tax=Capitella teleta TaxID=283909 RepID=R7T7Y8_CAPTE|nr:hypothetical protein CAPTEDRAFT_190094 [Capitella teleta]|eukprot:ELT89754.1 hypothetical protein CAPTEDRAFT_190094 [Capitella teleta]